jgi:AcrR family transcriptional regulator
MRALSLWDPGRIRASARSLETSGRQTCLLTMGIHQPGPSADSTAEQIDRAAYELFSRFGIHAVGVDTLAARAGVAKRTLYKYYPSKTELALAFLRRREAVWTRAWLKEGVERRAVEPDQKLLAIFDLFDEWFHRRDFEACAFMKVLLEHADREHPLRKASKRHIDAIRSFIRGLAADAGVPDPEEFARQWQILMAGSIIAAYAGDSDAARRAKAVGVLLLARHGVEPENGRRA